MGVNMNTYHVDAVVEEKRPECFAVGRMKQKKSLRRPVLAYINHVLLSTHVTTTADKDRSRADSAGTPGIMASVVIK